MKVIIIAALVLFLPSPSVATDNAFSTPPDNVATQKLSVYKDQQMNYINAMLDCVREKRRIFKEQEGLTKEMSINTMGSSFAKLGGSSRSQYAYQQSGNRIRDKFDELTIKQKENEDRLKDLEIRKGDLKLKVMETTNSIPPWWEENEAYYLRMKSSLLSP